MLTLRLLRIFETYTSTILTLQDAVACNCTYLEQGTTVTSQVCLGSPYGFCVSKIEEPDLCIYCRFNHREPFCRGPQHIVS